MVKKLIRGPRGSVFWSIAYLSAFGCALLMTAILLYGSGWFTIPLASRVAFLIWAPYTLTIPLVWRLAREFPLTDRRKWRNLLIHVGATIGFVMLCEVIHRGMATTIWPPRPRLDGFESPRFPPGFMRPPPQGRLFSSGFWPPPPRFFMKAQLHLAIYWLIVSTTHLVGYSRRLRQREQQEAHLYAELAQARLQSLQGQLQPHFLFNVLNSISALIYDCPKLADEMLNNLSDLLRVTLDQKQQPETSLENELLVLGFYLDIQRARFGDRLRIEQNVSPNVFNALVPAFILQPLVENAIEHGISGNSGIGLITLKAWRQDRHLCLEVNDNGCGVCNKHQPHGRGIGLSNTRRRLRTLYGEDHQIDLSYQVPTGFRVELKIPFHLEPVPISAT